MKTRRAAKVPAELEKTRQRFERWRQSRVLGTRIPESLWAAAVRMAERHGVCQTARVLGLGYYSLKKRVENGAAATPEEHDDEAVATFVELTAAAQPAADECTVELEDGSGAKMRIQVKGLRTPDLVALCRSFRGVES